MQDTPEVSLEFIQENNIVKHSQKSTKPYTKKERLARRNEVYRLHFDYGYSASKISELMKINRNTINSDISFLYNQAFNNWKTLDPERWIQIHTDNLMIQKTRLRELLEKTKTIQEKISLERLIFDLESKAVQIHSKLIDSVFHLSDYSTKRLNEYLKKHGSKDGYLSSFELYKLSSKTLAKISKIIKEDRVN